MKLSVCVSITSIIARIVAGYFIIQAFLEYYNMSNEYKLKCEAGGGANICVYTTKSQMPRFNYCAFFRFEAASNPNETPYGPTAKAMIYFGIILLFASFANRIYQECKFIYIHIKYGRKYEEAKDKDIIDRFNSIIKTWIREYCGIVCIFILLWFAYKRVCARGNDNRRRSWDRRFEKVIIKYVLHAAAILFTGYLLYMYYTYSKKIRIFYAIYLIGFTLSIDVMIHGFRSKHLVHNLASSGILLLWLTYILDIVYIEITYTKYLREQEEERNKTKMGGESTQLEVIEDGFKKVPMEDDK